MVIDEIYRRFSGKVQSFIIRNSGTVDDAADIFQETLIDLYQQARYKNLKLTCPFEPFLLLLCKRKWLNALKKRSVLPVTNPGDDLLHNVGQDVMADAELVEKRKAETEIYLEALEEIGERCKEMIQASLKGDRQDEIAKSLGVSYGYFRKKKSECMASLIQIIKQKMKS